MCSMWTLFFDAFFGLHGSGVLLLMLLMLDAAPAGIKKGTIWAGEKWRERPERWRSTI